MTHIKPKYHFLIFPLLCFFLNIAMAQQYNFKNFTPKNGLASSIVINIYQDNSGYLWFATQGGGVSRFNGKDFNNFTTKDGLIANDITCISEDKLGNIWIGTTDGVSKFDGLNFYNYTVNEGLVDNAVRSIYIDDKNDIWFATSGGGISFFDGKSFKKITETDGLSSNVVYAITQNKKGDYWFAMENGVSKYDGIRITNYDKTNILAEKTFFSIASDSKGNVWFGSVNTGVIKYNGTHFEDIKLPDEVSKDFIGSIAEDKHGNIWFATEHGALKFDGIEYTLFNEKKGLSSNAVLSITTDYEGNVWIGTQQGGVNLFSSEAFVNYTPKYGLISNKITTVFQTKDGEYIIGTLSNGITVLSNNTFSHLTSIPELSQSIISSIAIDNENNLWVGTTDGLFILKKQNGTYVLSNRIRKINDISLQQVVNIFQDKKGAIWIATYGAGLFKIDNNEEKQYSTANGLISNDILTMFKDSKDVIWLGTNDAGVVKFENGKFVNYSEKDGLANKSVWTIAEDDNHNMFFGTIEGGISCFNPSIVNTASQQFKTISTKEQLCSNNITALVWDNIDKSLWVGTDKGINKLKLTPDFKVKSLRYYGEHEGFKGVEVNQNAVLIDKKGLIWFGTTNGLSMYNRKFDYPNLTPPKLRLSNISLAYQNVDWRKYADSVDLRTNLPCNLVLSHLNNHLTFDFQALTTNNVKYTYILEGQDNDWSPLSVNTEANFTNIAPGKTYTFKVKAISSNNVWSNDVVAFSFTIKPPWWQTWWFYSLSALTIVGGVFGFINYRTSQLAKEKKVLEEKVIERTLELKGSNDKLSDAIRAITDSLNYAQRIQQSFLTSKNILKQTLKEYFIIYKPRDIVSGDFYWTYELPDRTLIACADSTGHGIPGAFMSLIGISLLNEISHSKNMVEPAEILDELRRIIICALNPEQLDSGGKDGMDIILISIFKNPDVKSDEVRIHFSGANNALYLISDQNKKGEFMEFKSDKQPVGFYSNMKPFTQQEIIAKKGDLIYMGTDGYADQFGGIKGKKFMSRQLKILLTSIYALPLNEQEQILDQKFQDWKNVLDQVDDVTVIGIKIG